MALRVIAFLACGLTAGAACKESDRGKARADKQPAAEQKKSAEPKPEGPPPVTLKPVVEGKAPENPYSAEQIARGKLLVFSGSCNDCHTPWMFNADLGGPAPDWSRMLSGHPADAPDPEGELGAGDLALIGPTFTSFKLPFGTTYALNLTPDIESGTGSWTEEMFLDVFRKGKHLGGDGRAIVPPMPWYYVRQQKQEDIIAIFAYLRSIKPIRNMVPDPKVPEQVLAGLDLARERTIALQKDPKKKFDPAPGPPPPPALDLGPIVPGKAPPPGSYTKEQVERGKHLATTSMCNDCHTPWKWFPELGGPAPDPARLLSGHPEKAPDPSGKIGPRDVGLIGATFTSFALPFGTMYSINLTPDVETGTGGWTEQQFLDVFRKGVHPDGHAVLPPMPWPMIRALPDEDLVAIFAYLRSIPPIKNKVPKANVPPPVLDAIMQMNAKLSAMPAMPPDP